MTETLVKMNHVFLGYPGRHLIDDIRLSVRRGDAIAVTGHNGVGKSTFLNALLGFHKQVRGTIQRKSGIKLRFVPEKMPQIPLKTKDYLMSMGKIQGIAPYALNARVEKLTKFFSVESMLHTPVNCLSKGTRQKINVIQSFLDIPDLLVLDEPLSGQDTESQQKFINMMKDYIQHDGSLVMSCHEKYLIDHLANRELCVKNYRMTAIQAPRPSRPLVSIDIELPVDQSYLDKLITTFAIRSRKANHVIQLTVDRSAYKQVLRALLQKNIDIVRLEHEKI